MKERKIKSEIVFKNTGTFTAYWAAEKWCDDNGYSRGSMCAPMPTAIMKGECSIAKWKNLSNKERATVDGIITHADHFYSYREGDVKIILYES